MSKVIVAYKQGTERIQTFFGNEPFITPEWGVSHAYAQENGMICELMSCLEGGYDGLGRQLSDCFPIRYEADKVFCGDWVADLPKTKVCS